MASVIDICNLALAHLGAQSTIASIDPPEGSTYAAHCARFFATARDTVLQAHPWDFAKKRVALALVGTAPGSWGYQYARPSDCLRTRAVVTADNETPQPYEQGNSGSARVIHTNVEDAVLIYTARVEDMALWDHGAATSLSYQMAYFLAMPVTRDPKYMAAMLKAYQDELAKATGGEANEQKLDSSTYTPAHLSARR